MLVKKKLLADKFIIELTKIFQEQNWNIEDSSNGEYSVFDMFCERLEELDDDSDRVELECPKTLRSQKRKIIDKLIKYTFNNR